MRLAMLAAISAVGAAWAVPMFSAIRFFLQATRAHIDTVSTSDWNDRCDSHELLSFYAFSSGFALVLSWPVGPELPEKSHP